MRKKPGDPCPYCDRKLSKQFFIDRELARGAAIKKALAESDMKGGRPRTIDYTAIWHLRKQGYSMKQMSEKLGVGRGVIQHAIRAARGIARF